MIFAWLIPLGVLGFLFIRQALRDYRNAKMSPEEEEQEYRAVIERYRAKGYPVHRLPFLPD